jgi:uncharacterized membrane protein
MSTVPPAMSRDSRFELLLLWLGVLGPPTAFLVSLGLSYAFVGAVCEGRWRSTSVLHVVPAFLLLITLLLGIASYRRIVHRMENSGWDRDGVLAVLGVLSASFFALVLIAHWIATLLLDPCLPPQ